MSVGAIAEKWHDQLLRTDPIVHEQAEAAVRSVYHLAGIAESPHFLWCASPLAAAWAVLVLVGKTEGYNHAVYEDIERSNAGRARIAEARSSVAQRLGIGEDRVEGYFGKPFYRAEGTDPVSKALKEGYIEAIMARAEAGDDFLAIHARGPFKPLHDLEHTLFYEGYLLRKGALRPSALREAMAKSGKQIEILGGRSAQHRLYGSMAYSEVAVDEALADAGKFQPTELQRTMWAAYEASGMWWPCEAGIVFAERPNEARQAGDSLLLAWSDGFTALSGQAADS